MVRPLVRGRKRIMIPRRSPAISARKISHISAGYRLNYYGNMSDDGMGPRFAAPEGGSASEHHAYYTVAARIIASGIIKNKSALTRWISSRNYGIV